MSLDGPWVSISGTPFISESGGNATYTVKLTDDGGNAYNADQPITVTIKYAAHPGDGYDGATPSSDFEVITYTVTVPQGQSSVNFTVASRTTSFRKTMSAFSVSIDSVSNGGSAYFFDQRVCGYGDRGRHPALSAGAGAVPPGHGVWKAPSLS